MVRFAFGPPDSSTIATIIKLKRNIFKTSSAHGFIEVQSLELIVLIRYFVNYELDKPEECVPYIPRGVY